MDTFSIFEAAKILNKDHTGIREWFKNDLIMLEDWQRAKGRGTKTVLLRTDLYRMKLFDVCLSAGVSRKTVADFVNHFSTKTPSNLPKDFNWDSYFLNISIWEDGGVGIMISKSKPHTGGIDAMLHISIDLKQIKKSVEKALEE